MNGKILMFAKVSLTSFIYDVIETFTFPNGKVQNFYSRHKILKRMPQHIITETDSTAFHFNFV